VGAGNPVTAVDLVLLARRILKDAGIGPSGIALMA
jgi:hypothetical protein